MKKPEIKKKKITELMDKKFIHLYDIEYDHQQHYYSVSRHDAEHMMTTKTDEERETALPDAVSCFLILLLPDEEPKLLLFNEFRYPTGQFVLSIPSGLIDAGDTENSDPILSSMIREIREETGITIKDTDRIFTVNPLLFCSPGLTDESTAVVCAVVHLDDLSGLNQNGAEGSEVFDGFYLYSRKDILHILEKGSDETNRHFPMVTFAAMLYFVSDLWKTTSK